MTLQERTLSVMACRHVNDVVVDAPRIVSSDMIHVLGIHLVVATTMDDRLQNAKDMGVLQIMDNPSTFDFDKVLRVIRTKQDALQQKVKRKQQAQRQY
eukprot:CAMPEP_0118709822 /NCGR_PEP_ID=MMETSP0800-20121206/22926_1 /TAXON_ID=210618 ORGANISM="Striatella unipunctata, Strain CCMP2910" /NCGR_SAMPLE_ID=MMETSP0800 /ASSEMBLY_ACC=CAM_ASM_000638 /LENGTH=97 /DNA_ID=CAMNT_0006613709 /DNA_START=244 /DNA_END=534 /DNA_ORIENTATION=+